MAVTRAELSEEDAKTLAENLIEYNKAGGKLPIPAGKVFRSSGGRVFEQFTRHPPGMIMPLGAFTHMVEASENFYQFDIGRYCSIARGSNVVNGHHPLHTVTTSPYHYSDWYKTYLPAELKYAGPEIPFKRSYGRGRIGNDVWIGAHCVLKAGITIGDGAVIASGSVVMKDVAPYTIIGGNPAKPLKGDGLRFDRNIVERFMALRWWDYSPASFRDINMYDVSEFLTEMERRKAAGTLMPFRPKRFKFKAGALLEVDD